MEMAYRNNMNPMKLMLAVIFATVIISMTLTGCKKCVSTEYKHVPVKIIDMMLSQMMKGDNSNSAGVGGMNSMLPFMMMNGNMNDMFDGMFDFDVDSEEDTDEEEEA